MHRPSSVCIVRLEYLPLCSRMAECPLTRQMQGCLNMVHRMPAPLMIKEAGGEGANWEKIETCRNGKSCVIIIFTIILN